MSWFPQGSTPFVGRSSPPGLQNDVYDGVSRYSRGHESGDASLHSNSWQDFDFSRLGNGICGKGTIVLSSFRNRRLEQRDPSTIGYAGCRFGRYVS
jgi:hypothetical protein